MPEDQPTSQTESLLHDLPRLIERMHRRYLDVVRLALEQHGAADISPVQYMMLQTIGADGGADGANAGELSVRDLIARGYYLGSNASYNLKQLVERGYVDRSADARDRRAARLKLTERGATLYRLLRGHDTRIFTPVLGKLAAAEIATTHRSLRAIERCWSDAVRDAGTTPDGDSDGA